MKTQSGNPDRPVRQYGRMRIVGDGRGAGWWRRIAGGLRAGCVVLGVAVIAVSLFGVPARVSDWLSVSQARPLDRVDCIVVLGGGGIPGESSLVRAYYGAQQALLHTGAVCIVALPADLVTTNSSVSRMRDELVLRGVAPDRVLLENNGADTYQQAAAIRDMLGTGYAGQRVLVVSSPEHMRRSLMCFASLGFARVSAVAATNVAVDYDFGGGKSLRYQLWCNLEDASRASRELLAILYYRLRGRI